MLSPVIHSFWLGTIAWTPRSDPLVVPRRAACAVESRACRAVRLIRPPGDAPVAPALPVSGRHLTSFRLAHGTRVRCHRLSDLSFAPCRPLSGKPYRTPKLARFDRAPSDLQARGSVTTPRPHRAPSNSAAEDSMSCIEESRSTNPSMRSPGPSQQIFILSGGPLAALVA